MAAILILLQSKSVVLSPGCAFESCRELLKTADARPGPPQINQNCFSGGEKVAGGYPECLELLLEALSA